MFIVVLITSPFILSFCTGDYLREKYDEATQVKLNKRGHLQVKDSRYKVPTATDLVYLDESPDWCRNTKQLQWPGMEMETLKGCEVLEYILLIFPFLNSQAHIIASVTNHRLAWMVVQFYAVVVDTIQRRLS